MKLNVLDVVLIAIFLLFAIVAGFFKIIPSELVAAIVTACLAFLTLRAKSLGGKSDDEEGKGGKKKDEPRDDESHDELSEHRQKLTDGTPVKELERGHSHRLLIGPDGSVKIEDVAVEPDEEAPTTPAEKPAEKP